MNMKYAGLMCVCLGLKQWHTGLDPNQNSDAKMQKYVCINFTVTMYTKSIHFRLAAQQWSLQTAELS